MIDGNNIKFNKSIKTDNLNDSIKMSSVQRDKIKSKISEKYGISLEESEIVLKKIEQNQRKKALIKKHNNSSQYNSKVAFNVDNKYKSSEIISRNGIKKPNTKSFSNNSNNSDSVQVFNKKTNNGVDSVINPKNIQSNFPSSTNFSKNNENRPRVSNSNSEIKNKIKQENSVAPKKNNLHGVNNSSNINLNENNNSRIDVDSVLSDILPDYNQQLSIVAEHLNLTFEVQTEKVDTIKESFIRVLKRDKSEKMKIHALNDVSFKIYKGEKVGIIGYNGAGKSTLLNVITGIYEPDGGKIVTNGTISPLLSLGAGFDYNYSGRKNIMLNGAVLGYDKEYLESKIDEIIEFSELGELIDIPIKNYSSGMLAKLGFSIATAVDPDILIIDEILGVGDVNFQKKSVDKMKSLMDGGTTVLLVSHSIPQIKSLCDKAIWIDKGKVREIGEVNKVCNNYIKDAEKASNEQLANIQFR